jgi:hypothetical protein
MNNPTYAAHDESGITCINAIRAALSPEEYKGFLKGCVIKYVWRENAKGHSADALKAQDYANQLYLELLKAETPRKEDETWQF